MSRQPTRILVADDDVSVRSLIRVLLESEGYSVLEAGDGREALEMIAVQDPDVLILDVGMPHIDGFGVLRKLQSAEGQEKKKARVLLLTGKVEEEDYLRGWSLGADAYLSKPFEPQALVGTIEEVLSLTDTELRQRREREVERARLLRQLDRFLERG